MGRHGALNGRGGVIVPGVDERLAVGPYTVRRAVGSDALAYAQADAEMVGGTYGYLMPPEFAAARLAEVPAVAQERATGLDAEVAAERQGDEPARRTWIATHDARIVGIAVTTAFQQPWEQALGVPWAEGMLQLNHLYVRPEAHGSGLGQALLDLVVPEGVASYLWIVGGNARAQRFYERNGYVGDGVEYSCGPVWFNKPLLRMLRPAQPVRMGAQVLS